MPNKDSILVFISHRDNTCFSCGEALSKGSWITLEGDQGACCLACADLDRLVYLPAGNMALTRRAKKHSTLSAVVLKFNRARKRSERQGLLVEEKALEQAEQECLADEDVRARRREREAIRREKLDGQFVGRFAGRVRELFPGCPKGVECAIAEHACLKSSGRVGRTAAAKSMDESAVRLAVIAHIRHTQTIYEQLLARGFDRLEARSSVHRRHAHLEIVSDRNARLVDEASLDPGRGTLGGTVPNDDGRTVGPVADPRTILAVRRVGVHLELISDRGA